MIAIVNDISIVKLNCYRFRNLLLYLGYQAQAIHDVKVNSMFKIISDFSAEFKLTRDKILKHRHKKEAKELKSLQQQRIQTAKNLSSKSEVCFQIFVLFN